MTIESIREKLRAYETSPETGGDFEVRPKFTVDEMREVLEALDVTSEAFDRLREFMNRRGLEASERQKAELQELHARSEPAQAMFLAAGENESR